LACAEGCLGRFYGGDIMKLLLCYARDWLCKYDT
jgi:2,3-bisphosphoglycerate-independent phosphoglycerate mutase